VEPTQLCDEVRREQRGRRDEIDDDGWMGGRLMRRGDGEILGIASQYRRRAPKGSHLFRSVFVFFCVCFLFCLFFLLLAWVLAEHAVFILLSIAWDCIQAVLTISYLLCYYISLLSFYSITLCPLLFLFYSYLGWDGMDTTTGNPAAPRETIGATSESSHPPDVNPTYDKAPHLCRCTPATATREFRR